MTTPSAPGQLRRIPVDEITAADYEGERLMLTPSALLYGARADGESATDRTVGSIFAAMDDLRDLAIMVRDAGSSDWADPAFAHQAANQIRRITTQLGVEAERLDGNLEYLIKGDHENANH